MTAQRPAMRLKVFHDESFLAFPFLAHLEEENSILRKLLVYLSSSATVSDEEVAAFLPTPRALVEMDRCWVIVAHALHLPLALLAHHAHGRQCVVEGLPLRAHYECAVHHEDVAGADAQVLAVELEAASGAGPFFL